MTTQPKSPAELVRHFPFFAGLDDATYAEILARGQTRRFEKDETLFHEGERARGLYFVQSGAVKIFKLSDSGREQIIELQRPGDSVAELPLFDHGPYPASAAALEPTEVLFIPREAFDAMLVRHPQIAQAVISGLAARLRKMVSLVADLSLRQVRQRLARFLWDEASGRTSFQLALTNDELAARLGSVRDVISRTLSALQADGIIRLHGRRVEILEMRRLAEEAG